MTPFQEYLDQCIAWAKLDKRYGLWAAENFAALDPHRLADLPAQLVISMRKLNGLEPLETTSKSEDTSQKLAALSQRFKR